MSYKKGDQIHIEDDDAMAASTTGRLRWILAISLLAAIAILSAIWIFGAFSQGDAESEITMSAQTDEGDDDDTLADDAVLTPSDDDVLGAEAES